MTPLHDARPCPRTAPETMRRVVVRHRIAGREDAQPWDRLLARHYEWGRSRLVGAALRYIPGVNGAPVALLGFARATLKGGARDTAIGWTPAQRADRRRSSVHHARCVIRPRFPIANRGAHGLGLTLRRPRRRAGGTGPPGGGRTLPRTVAAHADRGRPRRAEHGGGPHAGAAGPAPGRWRETARPGGPAPSLGGGAASARHVGPRPRGRQRKRNPGGPARAGPLAPRRDLRHRGGLAYKDPHGPAHRGPGRGVSAHHQRQPTASPSAAGAPSARGWCPLGGRGPRRATAGSTRRCGPPQDGPPPGRRPIS